MNDIELFLTTKIKNTGRGAAIGNFFLAPVRWLFSGKTIMVMGENFNKETGGIAEVSSFSWGIVNKSRHSPTLTSTDIDIGYGTILTVPFLLLATIPGIILGSTIKGLSYIKNSNAQKSHQFVKEILTPKDEMINLNEQKSLSEKKDVPNLLYENVRRISMSGQRIKTLIISGNTILDNKCAIEITRHIKPSKLILDGIKATSKQFDDPDWDNEALHPLHFGDYSGLESTYKSDAEFKKTTKIEKTILKGGDGAAFTLFFHPSSKNMPQQSGIVSSIQEGLREPSFGKRALINLM